ncbi:hypothetical protein [Salipiger abyssi]|uniref:Zinc-binding protein, primase-helicase n=1 Tax=Salipiger abyssi TaxID=1250539 RepID=A0A1P8UPB3_9RHOB|nr:hypothetical protein [Salipiger abyssi]APZ51243.1 zinc-binding protein, primase-helicase [Salipiger abyssi]
MTDPRLDEAKAISAREMVDRLGIVGLKASGGELIGPCPLCGGRDRFAINLSSHAFLCRRCDIRGGDNIALVMAVLGCDFRAALTWLCGDAPAQVDPGELARRRQRGRSGRAVIARRRIGIASGPLLTRARSGRGHDRAPRAWCGPI